MRRGEARRGETARNRSRNAAFRRSRRHSNTCKGRGHGQTETDGEVTSGLWLALWSVGLSVSLSLWSRTGRNKYLVPCWIAWPEEARA